MILITGANGFLGRHIVRRCAGQPSESQPRVLVRKVQPVHQGDFEVVTGDLADEASLRQATEGIETIVHVASKNIDHDGSGYDEVNVEGTRRLCRAAVAAGVSRLVYVSSVGVYGHHTLRDADESTPVRPDSPFSRSKAAAEEIVLDHHRRGMFTGVILRHRFVYGDGDRSLIPSLVRSAKKFPVWISGGRARTSVVLADDFAEVVRRVIALPAESFAGSMPVFHVTDGRPIAYRELVTASCALFGVSPPRLSIPFAPFHVVVRAVEVLRVTDPEKASISSIRLRLVGRDNYYSNRKLTALLPDLRFTPFAEGLARSAAYYEGAREI
ncbi:MAG TPA: NAD-dependent epimerase/dehydratase family protein [Thermoanaerobaculia bacterium]|nr:NAD-dependent epimerase/dehydratase family protein [Thermoanaerobaculia bacterium]